MDCVFCKIVEGVIPSNKVYEDDIMMAFHDIEPQSPVHIVMTPKEHIESANAINEDNSKIIAHIFSKVPEIAKSVGLDNGYRVVTNCGPDGRQSVFHIHFHLLGGKQLNTQMA